MYYWCEGEGPCEFSKEPIPGGLKMEEGVIPNPEYLNLPDYEFWDVDGEIDGDVFRFRETKGCMTSTHEVDLSRLRCYVLGNVMIGVEK